MTIFDFVKSKVSILDVVGEYVTLKPAGSYWKGHSPFQNERTPSFTVSPDKQIYYCFSSGQGGDVIDFVSKMENCSQIEAVQHLVERYNLTPPQTIEYNKKGSESSKEEKESYERACSFFATWCQNELQHNAAALDYVVKRSIDKKTTSLFAIGYCPSGATVAQKIVRAARKENLIAQDLLQAKIVMQGKHDLYCPFEDRIIFPIQDALGRFCGFGGRVWQPSDNRPKYYNSHDHDFFNKSTILFGLDKAKKSIQTQGTAFLVEGYTDCIAMVQAGYTNTIATLGTACTADHLKILARYAKTLFVLYDGDPAGRKAIIRLAQLCWQVHMELFVIALDAGEDPSSLLASGKTLDEALKNAQEIFLFFIEHLGDKFLSKPIQDKIATIQKLIATISTIPDELQQDMLLQRAATTFDIPLAILKKQLRQARYGAKKQAVATQEENKDVYDPIEKKLFSVILNLGKVLDREDEAFLIAHFSQPFSNLLRRLQQHTYIFEDFFKSLDEQEKLFVSKISLMTETEQADSALLPLMLEFQKKRWKAMINTMKLQLAHAGKDANNEVIQKMLEDFHTLKKRMRGKESL